MSDINLPAHLNEVLELMSREMGVPREALVSQAVYQLARLNGYVVPGKVAGAVPVAASPKSVAALPAVPAKPAAAPAAAAKPTAAPAAPAKPAPAAPLGLKKRAPEPEPESGPDSEPELTESPPSEDEEGNPFDEQAEEAPQSGEEPMEDEPAADEEQEPEEEPPPDEEPAEEEPAEEEEAEPEPPPASKGKGPSLVISMAGREPLKMTGDQVLVGRGKHCDFVIESNRCSREHARFTRKGSDFFVEDLGSSNGTFVGAGSKEKLTGPKKLKDGDDVTFGTEKVKVAIKK